MTREIDIEVTFGDESPEQVQSLLEQLGAHDVVQQKQRGVTGIEIAVVGMIAVQVIANLVIRLLPLWKSGVVVDARGSRIFAYKDRDLPRGSVLVLAKDGTQSKLHQPSELDVNGLLSTLLK